MIRRPKTLTFLAVALVLVAISLPAQVMGLYGHGLLELGAVMAKLTSLNWMVMALCIASAACIWRASPWTRIVLPLLIAVAALNNAVVGYFAVDFSPLVANLATLGFVGLTTPLLQPAIRELFTNPEKRWWLRTERKCVSVPVFIGGSRSAALRAETFDLSETGAFVPLSRLAEGAPEAPGAPGAPAESQTGSLTGPLKEGERITVRVTLGALSQIRCEGKVIRATNAKGNYPAGVGIQFVDLSWRDRREIRKYLDRQPEKTSA